MTTLQVFTVLLYSATFTAYTLLAGYVLSKNSSALENRVCALVIALFAIWALSEAFASAAGSPSVARLWTDVGAIGWCSFPVASLWFYLVITGHQKLVKNPAAIAAGIAVAAFFLSQQWTGHLITGFVPQAYGWSQVWEAGLMPVMYDAYFLLPVLGCICLIVRYGRSIQSQRKKNQARLLTVTPIVCLVLGSLTDVVLPALHVGAIPPLAVVLILIWGAALARAITRYGMLSLTPATAAESILATMADVLVLMDMEGMIIRANDAARSLLEYEEEELRGKDFSTLVGDTGSASRLALPQLLKEGPARNVELTLRTKGGGAVRVLFSASVMMSEDSEPVGIVAVVHDISDVQKVQQALGESERKYRSLVEHALIGIGIHQDNRIIFANAKLANTFGYSIEEFIGMPIADLLHPDNRDMVVRRAQHRQAGGIEPESYEIVLLKKDQSAIYALISNAVIEYEGRPATLITVADISDSKTRAALEQANKELESFSYSVSHDLRAPLRSIDGFSQALLEDYGDTLDAQARNYLDRVRAASQHMAALIDDLLKLSRVTRAEMCYEWVNLSAQAESIAAYLKEMEPDRAVDFVIAEGVCAAGDAALLQVVLHNLLSNAWKFTAKHAQARIEFGVMEEKGRPIYFVRDDGAGFDMAYADKLFTPFQRLHTYAEFEGTGIGLATVQRIIHRHGGRVWAEAQVEKGATFYFTLES